MTPTYPGQPGAYNPYDYNANSQYMNGYRSYGNFNMYNSMPNSQALSTQLQTAPMNIPQQTNNMQFALIPSREVAENATAEKGQTIYLMNQNAPEIYMKAADNFGLQNIRYFRLVEFNPNEEKQQAQQPNVNADYIPRSEFNQFVAAVSAEIENIKNTPVQPVTQQPVNKPTNSSSKKPANKDDANDK